MVQAAKPFSEEILELECLTREMAFVADVENHFNKSVLEFGRADTPVNGRDLLRSAMSPAHRFNLEHHWLYLKFLRAHTRELTEQFFAVYRSVGALMLRIAEALPEWHEMLSRLQPSPLTAYA